MSVYVKHWEWDSAEECLQSLFKTHPDMRAYGSLHVWQESFATLGGGNLAGSYQHLTPEMLVGRVYSVHFMNDSIGICYHDQIFSSEVINRSYPSKVRCVKLRLPTPEAV